MKVIALLNLFVLLLAPGALAQDDMRPTIAMLRYGGPEGSPTFVEVRVISMLENYGYVSAEEADVLRERRDLDGENVKVYWGDAGWDFANAALAVEKALDQQADVIMTITTPMTRAAVNSTLDLDDPPLVLGSSLLYPYPAGIGQDRCAKPDHVIGTAVEVPVAALFSAMIAQQPGLERIGILTSSTEASGSEGAAQIAELAETHGLWAKSAAFATQTEVLLAAESLMSDDIEAVITSWSVQISHNLANITSIAIEYDIPVYVPVLPGVLHGAALSAGYLNDNDEAVAVARLMASYLAGDLDPATTGLLELHGSGIGVNLDVWSALGTPVTPELMENADLIFADGEMSFSERYLDSLIEGNIEIPVEHDAEIDAALVESLQCAEE